ncbi:membrane protein [Gordonia phage VanLee]|uniref:Membrane protein n=1 Tax=Gordonia phage VanLee TaxID=2845816 RepID=A0A8F2D9F1_9CAUD|nr:membrane protein [Gordonia phage VanLee]QWS68185.1 membrane protein [Gordonia phage VanLee]
MRLAAAAACAVIALIALANGAAVVGILAGAATYAFARSARKDLA